MSDRLDGKQYVESRTTYGMSEPQPDTFASVKKRWRERSGKSSVLAKEAGEIGARLTNSVLEGSTVVYRCCADELERGLEQPVRELRAECGRIISVCNEHGPGHEGNCRCYKSLSLLTEKLTTLLGEKPRP